MLYTPDIKRFFDLCSAGVIPYLALKQRALKRLTL
jgi:hypothetical protein